MKIAAKIVQTNIRFVQPLLFHLDPLVLIHAQGRFRQRDVNVDQTLTILSMPSLGVTTGWQRQCPSHHPKADSVELKTDREAIGWWSISSRRPSSAASALSQSSANSSCADPAECADPHADNGVKVQQTSTQKVTLWGSQAASGNHTTRWVNRSSTNNDLLR